jgi:hypothetical protein
LNKWHERSVYNRHKEKGKYFIRQREKRKNNKLPIYETVKKKVFACVGDRLQAFNYSLDR